ncbi:hypothetical protein BACCAC_02801 [Bacteroides caccae ATCC 43185]|jgi:hypothetical protein|nr:hypothetical protein BACCAC_02801 [Bacteroides caccae ATCC 43185]
MAGFVPGFNKGIVSLKGRSRSSVRNRSFLLKEQGLGFKPKIDVNKMLNIKMLCYG